MDLPVAYFATNLVYPFTPGKTGIKINNFRSVKHWNRLALLHFKMELAGSKPISRQTG